jgi:hypothetical protein
MTRAECILNSPVPNPAEPSIPPIWAHALVAQSLHCRQCGYDLRHLRADSRCPECGLSIWESVVHTVDPAASRLPSIRNPRAVGNSLVALTLCMFVGVVLMLAPTFDQMLARFDVPMVRQWIAYVPELSRTYAAALAVIGLWAVWTLAPPRGREPFGPVWIDIWRITIGYIGWLAIGTAWTEFSIAKTNLVLGQRVFLLIALGAFAIVGLLGLRGVFRIIGQRSREYRRSRGGRQSLDLMILAIMVDALAMIGRQLTFSQLFPVHWREDIRFPFTVIAGIFHFMILLGLAYLVVNAIWIRRSLRRPPPKIEEVLALEGSTRE